MTRESSEGERSALQRLLEASSKLVGSFSADVDAELRPIVADVLAESGLLLTEVIESFGWNGVQFTRPVDVQKFISRLKALVYDCLQLMGRGAYASVFKVRANHVLLFHIETRVTLAFFARTAFFSQFGQACISLASFASLRS